MCERQKSSGKFSLRKHLLYDKWTAKNAFLVIVGIFNFEMTFDKNVVKKDNIFESFRFATMPQNSTLWQLLTVKILSKIPFE